jgi:hypothetical protein
MHEGPKFCISNKLLGEGVSGLYLRTLLMSTSDFLTSWVVEGASYAFLISPLEGRPACTSSTMIMTNKDRKSF